VFRIDGTTQFKAKSVYPNKSHLGHIDLLGYKDSVMISMYLHNYDSSCRNKIWEREKRNDEYGNDKSFKVMESGEEIISSDVKMSTSNDENFCSTKCHAILEM
uniref:Uncharacterized protein n=1 Tax=Cucumis melo TaxID=3656 RepID=A0A9I9EB57_CUCME